MKREFAVRVSSYNNFSMATNLHEPRTLSRLHGYSSLKHMEIKVDQELTFLMFDKLTLRSEPDMYMFTISQMNFG